MVCKAVLFVALVAQAGSVMAQGAVTKIAEKPPQADYLSSAQIYDIERCMLDMKGSFVPTVYSQPDRPDRRMLLWIGAGAMFTANVSQRADLIKEAGGTRVRFWNVGTINQARECAPPVK